MTSEHKIFLLIDFLFSERNLGILSLSMITDLTSTIYMQSFRVVLQPFRIQILRSGGLECDENAAAISVILRFSILLFFSKRGGHVSNLTIIHCKHPGVRSLARQAGLLIQSDCGHSSSDKQVLIQAFLVECSGGMIRECSFTMFCSGGNKKRSTPSSWALKLNLWSAIRIKI